MSTELITINKNALSAIKDKALKAELTVADKAALNVKNAVQTADNALKDMSRAFGKIVSEKLYEKEGYKYAKELWKVLGVKEARASQLVGGAQLVDVPGIGDRFNFDPIYTLASSKIPVETIKAAVESGELPSWSSQDSVREWVKAHAIESGKPEIVKTYSVHVVMTTYGKNGKVTENDYVNVPKDMFEQVVTEFQSMPCGEGKQVEALDNWKCRFYQSTDWSGNIVLYYRVPEKPDKASKKSAAKERAAKLEEENAKMREALAKLGINF